MVGASSSKTFLPAYRKWPLLRRLHEDFGVPLSELEPLAECKPETFRKRVLKESWQCRCTARTVVLRVNSAIDRQLGLLKAMGVKSFDEKQARGLAAMAKALETVAGIEKQFAEGECAVDAKDGDGNRNKCSETDGEFTDAATLEAELTAFIEANS